MAAHPAVVIRPQSESEYRDMIVTWGLPTTVAGPYSPTGNYPKPDVTSAQLNQPVSGNPDSYSAIATTDTCTAFECLALADKSVAVEGTFQTSTPATVTFTGSNDGVTFHTLHDAFGNLISMTAPGIVQVMEDTLWVKPVVTGGDGGTALNVVMAGRRAF